MEEIKNFSIDDIEKRMAEIRSLDLDKCDNIDELTKEVEALEERRKELKESADAKKELRAKILNGEVETRTIEKPKGERIMGLDLNIYNTKEEKRNAVLNSKEYREAFSSYLRNGMEALNVEQRELFTHTTENTGVLLPTQIQDDIWDLVHEAHCITEDIDNRRSNVVISIKKHTTIAQGKAKKVSEGVANDDEKNTFAEVNLAGKDFSKSVELSYAEQKMTNLEKYIIEEIATDIAEELAKDIFAKIDTDTNVANKIDTAEVKKLLWSDLTNAFAKVKGFKKGGARKVYMNEETYYATVCGATDADGKPLLSDNGGINGILKAQFRIDSAVPTGKLYIGIPSQFVNNVVQDIMVETDKDIKAHKFVYSGYARMEGSLINDKAFAILSVKES